MKLADYLKASYYELTNKVSWPTTQELINYGVVVLVASLIFALIILGMDTLSELGLVVIYDIFTPN